jgi:hypothetical protein
MNPPEPNDPLDARLHPPDEYRDDDGFTARVIGALPPRRGAWFRPALLLGAVAIGTILAVIWLPWSSLSLPDAATLRSLPTHVLMPWLLVISVLATLVWGILAALERND